MPEQGKSKGGNISFRFLLTVPENSWGNTCVPLEKCAEIVGFPEAERPGNIRDFPIGFPQQSFGLQDKPFIEHLRGGFACNCCQCPVQVVHMNLKHPGKIGRLAELHGRLVSIHGKLLFQVLFKDPDQVRVRFTFSSQLLRQLMRDLVGVADTAEGEGQ